MRDIPQGVLLLYTANKGVYTQRLYSSTAREFQPDPQLNRPKAGFTIMAPLLRTPFKVDKDL